MPYHIHTYEVPTFRDDHRTLQDNRAVGDPIAYDAFLHYSDDEVRMRTLSGGILGSTREEATGANGRGAIRKTRLSFELHPSVFYDDLFADDDVNSPQLAALVATLFGVDDDLFADDNVDVAENINAEDVVNSTKDNDAKLTALVDLDANIRTPRAA